MSNKAVFAMATTVRHFTFGNAMKRNQPFVIASILSAPFLVAAVSYLTTLMLGEHCPNFIPMLLLSVLILISTPGLGALILLIVSAFIVGAWLQKSKTRFEYVATSVYTVVILLHIGFTVWFNIIGEGWNL